MSTSPSPDSRFIWTNPDAPADEPTLLQLTSESLLIATVPKSGLQQAVTDLASGVGVAGRVIPLTTVTKLEGGEDDSAMTVSYQSGEKEEEIAFTFPDVAKREELIRALVDPPGVGWRRHRKRKSRWSVGAMVLTFVAAVTLITWACHREAVQIAAGKPLDPNGRNAKQQAVSGLMHLIEGAIGPTGVLIVGGILIGLGLLAFACLMAYPPVKVIVDPQRVGGGSAPDPNATPAG